MKAPLCIAVLAAALAADDATAGVRSGDRLLLMGDSQAYLLTRPVREIADNAGVRFQSEPVAGSSVIQWATSLEAEWGRIRGFYPTVVIISLGSNDACMGERIVANEPPFLRRFLRRLDRIGARETYWLGPPTIGNDRKLRRAAKGSDAFIAMLGRHDGYITLDSRKVGLRMLEDELHPTPNATKIWAAWLWEQIRDDVPQ